MNEWTFWIPMKGKGTDAESAWLDAMAQTFEGYLRDIPRVPEALFTSDEPVPSAEILGGSLSDGFGIDHGPEVEEITPLHFEDPD